MRLTDVLSLKVGCDCVRLADVLSLKGGFDCTRLADMMFSVSQVTSWECRPVRFC